MSNEKHPLSNHIIKPGIGKVLVLILIILAVLALLKPFGLDKTFQFLFIIISTFIASIALAKSSPIWTEKNSTEDKCNKDKK